MINKRESTGFTKKKSRGYFAFPKRNFVVVYYSCVKYFSFPRYSRVSRFRRKTNKKKKNKKKPNEDVVFLFLRRDRKDNLIVNKNAYARAFNVVSDFYIRAVFLNIS